MNALLAYALNKRNRPVFDFYTLNTYDEAREAPTWDPDWLKPSERIAATPAGTVPRLSLDDLSTCDDPEAATVVVLRLASFGDYNNTGTVERSNHRVILAEFGPNEENGTPGLPGLLALFSSYWDGLALYLPAAVEPTDEDDEDADEDEARDLMARFLERLTDLDDYPVLDDDDLSALEMDIEAEGWDDYLSLDLARDIEKKLSLADLTWRKVGEDGIVGDGASDAWLALVYALREEANENPVFEDPTSCYIDTAKMAEKVTLDMLTEHGVTFDTYDDDDDDANVYDNDDEDILGMGRADDPSLPGIPAP